MRSYTTRTIFSVAVTAQTHSAMQAIHQESFETNARVNVPVLSNRKIPFSEILVEEQWSTLNWIMNVVSSSILGCHGVLHIFLPWYFLASLSFHATFYAKCEKIMK